MNSLIMTFAVLLVALAIFTLWLNTRSDKKWLKEL